MNRPPETVTIWVDGEPLVTRAGRTVAAALMVDGDRFSWRRTRTAEAPRGAFCGIGVCFDCLVTVDDRPSMRACLVPVHAGLRVSTGLAAGAAGGIRGDGIYGDGGPEQSAPAAAEEPGGQDGEQHG